MKQLVSFILLFALIGCTPAPRYGAAGGRQASRPIADESPRIHTNDVIRLGMILQSYLGRPYKGNSKYVDGVDCSLFTQQVYRDFNKTSLPRTAAEQYTAGFEVSRRSLEFGDLVFFMTERNKISHVGVFVGGNQFIHATDSWGVIISSLNENYWVKRYVGARRVLAGNAANTTRDYRVRTGYGNVDD